MPRRPSDSFNGENHMTHLEFDLTAAESGLVAELGTALSCVETGLSESDTALSVINAALQLLVDARGKHVVLYEPRRNGKVDYDRGKIIHVWKNL